MIVINTSLLCECWLSYKKKKQYNKVTVQGDPKTRDEKIIVIKNFKTISFVQTWKQNRWIYLYYFSDYYGVGAKAVYKRNLIHALKEIKNWTLPIKKGEIAFLLLRWINFLG